MSNSTSLSRRAFVVMPFALAACRNRSHVIEIVGYTMGTSYKVVAVDHEGAVTKPEVQGAISAALQRVNATMSNWDEASEISRINAAPAGAVAALSPELAAVMRTAAEVSETSLGRFDTTVGPLIELWGFGASGQYQRPTDRQIAQMQAISGHRRSFDLADGQLQKHRAEARIYLAGIGKGFGADHIGRGLEALGLSDYLIEIGGDLYASGRNADGLPWQIGIESPDPLQRGAIGVVGISGKGMASSGDYRNYFETEGQRYSHLIDPVSGRPVDHATASATVIAETAMLADAWSTAMLILGRARGLEIAEAHNIAVQFVDRAAQGDRDFVTYQSNAFALAMS